jgi:histone-lysine N-methyltransferase ASH1L
MPPPIHVGKHLRERQCDFLLSYDIWWQLNNDLVKKKYTPLNDSQIVALYALPAYPCTV